MKNKQKSLLDKKYLTTQAKKFNLKMAVMKDILMILFVGIFLVSFSGDVSAQEICSEGEITLACHCGENIYNAGYCCQGNWFDPSYEDIFSGCPSGNFYYVDQNHVSANDSNSGTEDLPWETIQKATETLQAGDTVIVKEGHYTCIGTDIRYHASLNVVNSGTVTSPIIVKTNPGDNVEISMSSSVGPLIGVLNNEYIVWDGFKIIEGDSYRADMGPVVVWNSDYVTIQNCEIVGTSVPNIDNHNGFRVDYSNNVTVRNNVIHGIYGSGGEGVNPQNHAAVMMYYSVDCLYENNLIYNCYTGFYPKGGYNGHVFRYNVIRNCVKPVKVSYHEEVDFYQNLIYDNEKLGFQPSEVITNISFFNNVIYNSPEGVNQWYAVSGFDMWNNVFLEVSKPMSFGASQGTFVSNYNNYYAYDYFRVNDRNIGGLSEWQALGFDANSIEVNPLFVDSSNLDFHLQGNSPLISAGIDWQDYDNNGNTTERIPMGMYLTGDETIGLINLSQYLVLEEDTTSPSRSNAQPTGTLTSGTTQTTISLTTNETATCKYGITAGVAYSDIANTFTTTGGISHAQILTNLTNGTTYNYYVRCSDSLNNVNTTDYSISFSVSAIDDTTPPTGSISINSDAEYSSSTNVDLAISASDSSGVTEMKISDTNDFANAVTETYNTVKSWVLTTGDGIKTVYAWFKDTVGNWTNDATPVAETIILDETAPVISNILASNITTTSAQINFNTNEQTTSYIEYGLTTSYGSQTTPISSVISFALQVTGLSANTTYNYRITSTDSAGNISQSTNQSFMTAQASTPDTTPPANITNLSSSNITQTSVDLSWTASGDDGSVGTASEYDLRYSTSIITNTNWNEATELSGEPIPQMAGSLQSVYVSVGLSPNTTYYFAIKSSDEVPNWSDISNILSVTTTTSSGGGGGGGGSISDNTPPDKPSNFISTPADSQIYLTWDNPTDEDFVRTIILKLESTNEDLNTIFQNCPTNCDNKNIETIYEGTNEEYTDIDLDNNKTYYYAIYAYDRKPNYSMINAIQTSPEEGTIYYEEGTLLKTKDSFKVYVIINQKKKWIPTPEVFETLGYQWTTIKIITKEKLNKIQNYEDNLIRAIGNYKVYLIVNGISRHIPNPEIFLNYGFDWEDIVDVPQETINKYQRAYLIRESRQGKIYYLREDGIKKHIPNPEIFASYNNRWGNIQVISKPEMDAYPEPNLIQLEGDNRIYLIEGNTKRHISSAEVFTKRNYNWNQIMTINEMEFRWYNEGKGMRD